MTEENKDDLNNEVEFPELTEKREFSGSSEKKSNNQKQNFITVLLGVKKKYTSKKMPKIQKSDKKVDLTLTLKEAYELLHISAYPPTNEEIRIAYYREEYKCDGEKKEEKIQQLIQAKSIILDNITINPFIEESTERETFSAEKKISDVKNAEMRVFRKNKVCSKKKISELFNETQNLEEDIEVEPVKGKPIKRTLLRFVLIVVAVIGILYFNFKNDTLKKAETNPAATDKSQQEEKQETITMAPYIDLEKAVYLAQSDGISLDTGILYPKKECMTDFLSSQNIYIPGINLILLDREFILHNSTASIKVKNKALYSFTETNNIDTSYKKIKDWSTYEILSISLDGIWTGDCTINNKHLLKANNIELSSTKNGYLSGKYKFFPETAQIALLLIEGQYDKTSNKFLLYGKEWLERPSLFVTPRLEGYYNPITDALESTQKNSNSARFSFKKEREPNNVIEKEVACHLLKDSYATYQTSTQSYGIPLSQLTEITEISITGTKEETCEVSYKANLDRAIVDYTIEGKANFHKSSGMWLLTENEATATFKSIDLCGTYKGTEIIEEELYNGTYKIYPSTKENTYIAEVTLKPDTPSLKKIRELRNIEFIEMGIKMERTDLFNGEILGSSLKETYMDYTKDYFINKNGISLYKISEQY